MTENRRYFTRVDFTADAKLIVDQNEIQTEIVDVSLKGALMEVEDHEHLQLTTEQAGELFFRLTSSDIEVKTQVLLKRVSKNLIGVSFESIDIESAAHLKRLVELNLGGEEMIEREIESLVAQSSS